MANTSDGKFQSGDEQTRRDAQKGGQSTSGGGRSKDR